MAALDRPVPILRGHTLPAGATLADWSTANALDPARIARLNPALTGKRGGMRVLAPALPDTGGSPETLPAATTASADIANADTGTATQASAGIRRHTVCSGESAWSIARRYGIPVKTLLARNNLDAKAVLKPGMVLRFDEPR